MTSLDYDRRSRWPAGSSGGSAGWSQAAWSGRSKKVAATGTEGDLLGPGPEDLDAIGANLMDPRRREKVLETSLRTSALALRAASTTYAAAG
jgi:hypothetical protein